MGEPARHLKAVGAATEELRETASQALEWVRVSEERVARAEARSEKLRAEVKERAMATLRKIGEEGRERIAAERGRRREAEARARRAEEARDRAETAFEKGREQIEAEAAQRHDEALKRATLEADQRVAAAEQRAVEAEAAAHESRELAIRL